MCARSKEKWRYFFVLYNYDNHFLSILLLILTVLRPPIITYHLSGYDDWSCSHNLGSVAAMPTVILKPYF